VLIHANTELGARDLLYDRMTYVASGRRIRRANGPLALSLQSGPNNQCKDLWALPRCASVRCFASSRADGDAF